MKRNLIIGLVLFVMMFIGVTANAGPVQDLIRDGYLSVKIDGDSALVLIEPILYRQMTYMQKAGLVVHIIRDYGVSNVYAFKMGVSPSAWSMLFAFSPDKGFRVYR